MGVPNSFDVDGYDSTYTAQEIEDTGEEQRRSATGSSTLDYHARFRLEDDLLKDPQIQWALASRETKPVSFSPDLGTVV